MGLWHKTMTLVQKRETSFESSFLKRKETFRTVRKIHPNPHPLQKHTHTPPHPHPHPHPPPPTHTHTSRQFIPYFIYFQKIRDIRDRTTVIIIRGCMEYECFNNSSDFQGSYYRRCCETDLCNGGIVKIAPVNLVIVLCAIAIAIIKYKQ